MKRKRARRQIFVFTTEEKRVAACVIGAILLGLAAKEYRAENPRPAPPATVAKGQATKVSKRALPSAPPIAQREETVDD